MLLPLGVGLVLAAPLAVGEARQAAPAPKVAPADGVERSRDRVRSRSEWRQLRRQTRERPDEDVDTEGCNDRQTTKRSKPKERSDAGCAGLGQAFSGLSAVLMGLGVAILVGLILWAIVKLYGDKDAEDDEADFGDEAAEVAMPATPPGRSRRRCISSAPWPWPRPGTTRAPSGSSCWAP